VLGSQIDPMHTLIRVRAGNRLLLVFAGAAALWWVADMPSSTLRAAFDRLLGEISQRSVAP
jgi:hypothetical protein